MFSDSRKWSKCLSDKFPFKRCIICLCYFNRSQMNVGKGGGGGHSVLYPAKVCRSNLIIKFSTNLFNIIFAVLSFNLIVFGSAHTAYKLGVEEQIFTCTS